MAEKGSLLESLKAKEGEDKSSGVFGIIKRLTTRKKKAEVVKAKKAKKGESRDDRFKRMSTEANEALKRLREKRGN